MLSCGRHKLEKRVAKVEIFKSIRALLDKYSISDINHNFKTEAELRRQYYSFPDYREKIKRFGLIAFELR